MRERITSKMLCGAVLGCIALFPLAAHEAMAQGDAKAGAEVFQEQKCARCHGDRGKGDGPTIEKLKTKVQMPNWTDKTAVSQLPDEYFAQIIAKGGKAIGKSAIMPSFGEKLTETQITNLVAFIRSLAP